MKQISFANVERYEREVLGRIDLEPIVEAMPDMRSLRFSADGLWRLGRRAGSRRVRGLRGRGVT